MLFCDLMILVLVLDWHVGVVVQSAILAGCSAKLCLTGVAVIDE